MVIKKARTAFLPLPARQWVHRASLAAMVACGLGLLVMGKTGNPAVSRLRTAITDIAAPVLGFAASPLDAWYEARAWMGDMARLREENIFLKNQNIELLKWQDAAKSLQSENDSLQALLSVVPEKKMHFVTARLVSDTGGPYGHSALVSGGAEQGIHKDAAALSENGLLGRIIEVGASSARVLLLSDLNSRIPVIAEQAHEKSILTGNNTGLPTLAYLPANSKIAVGDRLVTSGDGGVFPRGIPVGVVTATEQGKVTVQPFADAAAAEYVSVIDYSF